MGQAQDIFESHRKSPERALHELVPFLSNLRTYAEQCRAEGSLMDSRAAAFGRAALEEAPLTGGPVTSRPEAAELARSVRGALEGVLKLWEANRTEEGHCPPLPGIAAALRVLDDPLCEPWRGDGEANRAYDREYAAVQRAAQDERQAEIKERTRGAIKVGQRVALCDIGGCPTVLAKVVGGDAEEGFLLEDGRTLTFLDTSFGDWAVEKDGRRQGLQARPAHPLDEKRMALAAGRLSDEGRRLRPALLPAPKDEYVARAVPWPREARLMGAGSVLDVDRTIGEVLPRATHGDLLAYMIRRFGPPTLGGDTYKSMCGGWLLSTPMPDMVLMVEPSPSGVEHSLRPLLHGPSAARLREAQDGYSDDLYGRAEGTDRGMAYLRAAAPYARALRAALCDLLRSVYVRDVPINAQGRVEDDDRLLAYRDSEADGPDEGMVHGVAYNAASVVGMPIGFFDDFEALGKLLGALRRLDPDDPAAAMRRMAEMVDRELAADGPETPDAAPGPAPR